LGWKAAGRDIDLTVALALGGVGGAALQLGIMLPG
jgi:hypothetical protein